MFDSGTIAGLLAVKVARLMVLWVALYLATKVYQDEYVERVLVQGGTARPANAEETESWQDASAPPRLQGMVVYALVLDLGMSMMLGTILLLLSAKFKQPNNTFVIDGAFLRLAAVDYAAATFVISVLGILIARAVQNPRALRFREDGMRGTRAFGTLMLYVGAVVLAIPFFSMLGSGGWSAL